MDARVRMPRERVVRRRLTTRPERMNVGPRPHLLPRLGARQSFVAIFVVTIAVGTILLDLPWASTRGDSASVLVALFTATSATFVTGLTVVDTSTYWTGFGHGVIAALIQVGGLGYMTGVAFFLIAAKRHVGLGQRKVLQITFGGGSLGHVDIEARNIILLSVAFQIIGLAFLAGRFLSLDAGLLRSTWLGLFHSISAFHNAGFDITGGAGSIAEFRSDPWIIGPLVGLALIGSLGMNTVIAILAARGWRPLVLDGKLVVLGTAIVVAIGFVFVLLSEWSNPATLGASNAWGKVADATTLAVGNRTSGFETFNTGMLHDNTLFVMVCLMFIGGASGSMTGGVKVNVLTTLTFTALANMRGRTNTTAFHREILGSTVRRAVTIVFVSFVWVNVAVLGLSFTEHHRPMELLFEVSSAFGLVGLSTGITPTLTIVGQLVIIATMFAGRLAPFLVALELANREQPSRYRFAKEEVRLG